MKYHCRVNANNVDLNQQLINDGIETGDIEIILNPGIWMLVLAVISGLALGGTAYLAIFFSQGTGYFIRSRRYQKIQTFSFGNFDRFRTGVFLLLVLFDLVQTVRGWQYGPRESSIISRDSRET